MWIWIYIRIYIRKWNWVNKKYQEGVTVPPSRVAGCHACCPPYLSIPHPTPSIPISLYLSPLACQTPHIPIFVHPIPTWPLTPSHAKTVCDCDRLQTVTFPILLWITERGTDLCDAHEDTWTPQSSRGHLTRTTGTPILLQCATTEHEYQIFSF